MNLIKKNNPDFTLEKLEKIKYGLEGVYILATKFFIIIFLAFIFNIVLEVMLFIFIYTLIKTYSGGLHATRSWICLLASILIFVNIPIISKFAQLPINLKIIIAIITVLLIYKNSPADTYKKPIINPKKRKKFKLISTIVALAFAFLAIIIENNFISNLFLFSLILQTVLTLPLTYKIFKLPYNNYLKYI